MGLIAILSAAALSCAGTVWSEVMVDGRPSIVFEGDAARAVVDIGGGAIVDFHLNKKPLNPLSWREDAEATGPGPRWMGHFVCLDRWGAPGEGEAANGMPFHGEASRIMWKIHSGPDKRGDAIEAEMSTRLPLAGLEINRHMAMSSKTAYMTVTETVTNHNKLGRVYNMVQHPSISPPFLSTASLIDCNGRKGFMDSSPLPNPEEPPIFWPQSLKDGLPLNMRRFPEADHADMAADAGEIHDVVSYVIDEEYGWITASNPEAGLLIGYVWRTEDYPWVIQWRHLNNGIPVAIGLEFGTTGLHQPPAVLVAKHAIFGRRLFDYLDTGESTERSYGVFLSEIPSDYNGVARVIVEDGTLTVKERGVSADQWSTPGGNDLVFNVGEMLLQ